MRNYLLAAAAAAAFATPALAADNSGYVGIEGGVLFPKNQHVDATVDFTNPANTDVTFDNVARVKNKTGYDVDLIGGYDFGMFRLEGELGYKRAKLKNVTVDNAFLTGVNTPSGNTFGTTAFDLNGHTSVLSGMVNGLVDFGGDGGVGGYAGAGIGRAHVKQLGDSDNAWAYQLLAGVYMPVSSNIDVGLKYRYFRTGKLNFNDEVAFSPVGSTCGALPCSGGTAFLDTGGRFSSHSLLASLTYNFGARAVAAAPVIEAPLAPPPAAPATQSCPDGSVILATSTCAVPPPPPPPPPVERGERGR